MAGRVVADAFAVHLPIPAEQIVLGSYTLLPHHRTGIAAALRHPFDTAAPTTAKVNLRVPVVAAAGTDTAEVTLKVRGPGDVASVDARQIIRRYPAPGTANAEPSDLAHVEFDAPDLPWQFTPTGPDAQGHLPPWLRLVVIDAAVATVEPTTSGQLPVLHTPRSELPPPADAWAWAHAQVLGNKDGNPSVAERLAPATPLANLSRLIAPRQLPKFRSWIACVVPTFKAGAQAGLGSEPTETTLAYSWGAAAGGEVTLPVYDYWTFATGPDGDFETLAERLTPVKATGSVGERRVDTSHPGNGIDPVPAGADGRDRHVRGALSRPGALGTDGAQWPSATTEDLRRQLEAPDANRYGHGAPAQGEPDVAPPIYAGAHTVKSRVPDGAATWFRDVNLDPADRIVAGLGTRVVHMDQESLMASAWAQVEGVENTNRALRIAQLGRYASESLHRRHLGRLDAANLLAVSERVSSRILVEPGETLMSRLHTSVLPAAAAAGTLRRLSAPRGRVSRFVASPDGESAAVSRALAVRRLLADGDGNARSWVRTYADPDGLTTLLSGVVELLPAEFRESVAGQADQLAAPALPELLAEASDDGTLGHRLRRLPNLGRDITASLLDALLSALPTRDDIAADRTAAEGVADMLRQLLAVVEAGRRLGYTEWLVRDSTAKRVGVGRRAGDGTALVTSDEVLQVVRAVSEWARAAGYPVEVGPDNDLVSVILGVVDGAAPAADFGSLAGVLVRSGGVRDIDRSGFTVASLGLVDRLDPKTTLTKRVLARLPVRELWPDWLPHDWFDDSRIEQVLAAPRFDHPMYEALDRYDREWLMPGVGAMKPHEMVTLLQTNARFAEAFLIGLNTEFARELVWRGYPTDGRATSFYSFWTPAAELVQPLHRFDDRGLGEHIDPALNGAIVLLVRGELIRRYPHVLAHAVTQAADEDPPKVFAATPAENLFRLHLEPDLLLIGFNRKADQVVAPSPGRSGAWWFTLSEHVGEPRFGLDEVDNPADRHAPGATVKRDDLQWGDIAQDGDFLVAGTPQVKISEIAFRSDAAYLGWLLFQQPSRAAFAAADIMEAVR
ncbi:hypothetical protein BH09ACT7_BH09ACT7_35360 [soil metagenome]